VRIIEMSGGLEFGPPQGPWIDIIPIPRQPVTVDVAIRTAKMFNYPTEWRPWQSFKRQYPVFLPARKKVGVIGVNETTHCHIRFLYQRGQRPVQALYAIEEFEAKHGDGLPPALAGAALAAARAKKYPTVAPMIIARLCDLQPPGEITHFNRRQIKTLTDVYIGALINGDDASLVTMPGGSTDRARFWLAVGQRLWDPQTRVRIARQAFLSPEVILTNSSLAAAIRFWCTTAISQERHIFRMAPGIGMGTRWYFCQCTSLSGQRRDANE